MTLDDLAILHKHPFVRLDDGRKARVIGPKMDHNFWRVEIQDFQPKDEDDTADKVLHIKTFEHVIPEADDCEICFGVRGGVPGNENIMYGMTVCDYCSSDIITVERAVRDQTLKAAAKIARLTRGGYSANVRTSKTEQELIPDRDGPWVLNCEIADRIESVRLTPDGRWKSSEAMKLWGDATDTTGEDLHRDFDGNGRKRHD